jgi:hypothetical protein
MPKNDFKLGHGQFHFISNYATATSFDIISYSSLTADATIPYYVAWSTDSVVSVLCPTSASPERLQRAKVITLRLDTVWVRNGLRQVWRLSNQGASEVSTLATCIERQIKKEGTLIFAALQSVVELTYSNLQVSPEFCV